MQKYYLNFVTFPDFRTLNTFLCRNLNKLSINEQSYPKQQKSTPSNRKYANVTALQWRYTGPYFELVEGGQGVGGDGLQGRLDNPNVLEGRSGAPQHVPCDLLDRRLQQHKFLHRKGNLKPNLGS